MIHALSLSLALFLLPLQLTGQYFISDSAVWNLQISSIGFSTGNMSIITWEYKFGDEVEVDSVVYKRLYSRQREQQPDWEAIFHYLYREENGIVYRYATWSEAEEILYNFNIDSINQIIGLADISYRVLEMDSTTLLSGEKRRRVKLETVGHWAEAETWWIDGIGSIDDTMDPNQIAQENVDGPGIVLECFAWNGEILYKDYEESNCYTFYVNSEEASRDEKISLGPNPVRDILEIVTADEGVKLETLVLFDVQGSRLREISTKGKSREAIDLSELPAGIYFLKVRYFNGGQDAFKVVKI